MIGVDELGSGILGPLLTAFIGGFLTSLTPCVYPLIPITLAVFGARGDQSRLRACALSITYVLGIAFTYTGLGILSARAGNVFGSSLGSPYVVFPLVLIFILLALYTLGIVEGKFIAKLQTRANRVGGTGFVGAFTMGVVSGGVAAPCVGPSLLAILAVAAHSQHVGWAAALLFTYSLGLGVLFVLLGTFSGLIDRLPKSGNWLYWIKFVISAGIFALILFMLQPFVQIPLNYDQHLIVLVVIGAIGVGVATFALPRQINSLTLLACILVAISAYHFFVPGGHKIVESAEQAERWITDFDQALATGKMTGKIVMVDLYADWCAACKEYDLITFSNAQVRSELSKVVAARLDLTKFSAENKPIRERYRILGLPAILFLRDDGSELQDSRLTGFKGPDEFLVHLARVLSSK